MALVAQKKIALLVEELAKAGVKVAAFDVVFAEPESNSASELANDLAIRGLLQDDQKAFLDSLQEDVSNDKYLAGFRRKTKVILGYVFHGEDDIEVGKLGFPVTQIRGETAERMTVITRQGYSAALRVLQRKAKDGGFINVVPDSDGLIRRTPLLIRHDNGLYPSISLAAAMHFADIRRIKPVYQEIGNLITIDHIEMGDYRIPTDGLGRMTIGYQGGPKSYRYVSATDVMNGQYREGGLEETLVLIGTTVLGLSDVRAMPLSQSYPGVEVHASVIDSILRNHMPFKPAWEVGVLMVGLLSVGVVLSFALPFLKPGWLLLVGTVALSGIIGSNLYAWQVYQFDLTMISPLALLIALMSWNLISTLVAENSQRRAITSMFGQYVPSDHVEAMLNDPAGYSMEGESKEMSVMFADIRGFTNMSEKLTAGELKMVLNRFFTPITRVIFENQGTIDKYVGDMVMAFWGAPLDDPKHQLHAIRAGFAMHEEIRKLKIEFAEEGLPEIDMGIGINTGPMNVGDMGSTYRRAYTVLGDSVNLGSRVESLTKFYGSLYLVTENTKNGIDEYVFRSADNIRVKGKLEPVKIFEPVCAREDANQEVLAALARYHAALELYTQQQWDAAEAEFTAMQSEPAHQNTTLLDIYLERIEELREQDLGENWDGVYTHTSK